MTHIRHISTLGYGVSQDVRSLAHRYTLVELLVALIHRPFVVLSRWLAKLHS